MSRVFVNLGAAIVVAGACVLFGIVMSSPASRSLKAAILLLCLSVVGFVAFTTVANRDSDSTRSPRYRRLALVCWGVAALALAVLAAGAFFRIL